LGFGTDYTAFLVLPETLPKVRNLQ
jgi:hypothetical protein